MKKIVLYGHGGSYNHGSEGIVKSTIAVLRKYIPDCKIVLSSHFPEQDIELGVDADEFVGRDMSGKTDEEIYSPTINKMENADACIHIGGDNYCHQNWRRWAMLHYKAIESGAKSVLWSASIDNSMITDEMLEAFSTHTVITARDSISHEIFIRSGLKNIVRVADVDFTLGTIPYKINVDNYLVINLSPVVFDNNKRALASFGFFIDYLLANTDLNIVFIPYVIQTASNDYEPLKLIYRKNNERLLLIDGKLKAEQYKHIVSNAKFCVTSRNHLAIAAYSSYVPVMIIDFASTCARMSSDLNMLDYVLRLDNIVNEHSVVDLFLKLQKDESKIRAGLLREVPELIKIAINENVIKSIIS